MNRILKLTTVLAVVVILFPTPPAIAATQDEINKAKAAIKTLEGCKSRFNKGSKEYDKCMAADKTLTKICGEHTGLMSEKQANGFGATVYYAKDSEISQCSKKVNQLKATPKASTSQANTPSIMEATKACGKYENGKQNFNACVKGYNAAKTGGTVKSAKCSGSTEAACMVGARAGKADSEKEKTAQKKAGTEDAASASAGAGAEMSGATLDELTSLDITPVEEAGANADQSTIDKVVNIVFSLAGGLALLFTVIGGLRFILSSGDPQNTARAKNTIIYALVGLIVTMFAFAIVKFVTSRVL